MSVATQTLSTTDVTTNYETAPEPVVVSAPAPKHEVLSYSKGIQTSEVWSPRRRNRSSGGLSSSGSDPDQTPSKGRSPMKVKRLSRREREKEEDLRQILRREIEEELKPLKDPTLDGPVVAIQPKHLARALTSEELNAVTASDDFLDFVERSSKVIERALDEDYDVLADYAMVGLEGVDEDEDEGYGSSRGKKGRKIREVAQFYDERWSKKRMISDIGFSPKVDFPISSPRAEIDKIFSFPNFSWHRIQKTPPPLKTLPAFSKSGTCIFTLAPNTPSTAPPTFSPPNSLLSIPISSSAVPTADKFSSGTLAPNLPFQSRKHPSQEPQLEATPIPYTPSLLSEPKMPITSFPAPPTALSAGGQSTCSVSPKNTSNSPPRRPPKPKTSLQHVCPFPPRIRPPFLSAQKKAPSTLAIATTEQEQKQASTLAYATKATPHQ